MIRPKHLAFFPTPLHRLDKMSGLMGHDIWIKRDDQTGLAGGGNKARKLEFLIADALNHQADRIITAGAAQSNHCRQTAAAARIANLSATLVLSGSPDSDINGNLLLDHLLGTEIIWTTPSNRIAKMEEIRLCYQQAGQNAYAIPIGGSNAVGTLGYIQAMQELQDQISTQKINIDHIILASSSGGTQAGLVAGAKLYGFQGKITGISIDKGDLPEESYISKMTRIAREALTIMHKTAFINETDFALNRDFSGVGYGVVSELEKTAIRKLAIHEGIFLDPVYTGRAWGGMESLIKDGYFSENESILFWHTGGAQALFAYAQHLI